jgi:hypothetical protein
VTDHFQEALALLDAAEERQRDEARSRAEAARGPVTPECALADALNRAQSTWLTIPTASPRT